MQSFNDLVTSNPQTIEQIFISDLHLPLTKPVSDTSGQAFLAHAFLNFLDSCIALPKLEKLYILGDWFEAWLGDDVADTPQVRDYLMSMLEKLQTLAQRNVQILVMVGNRDFLLGQHFCDKFGGTLIKEPFFFDLADKKIRLEHGDALCTDDKSYQRFRTIIQHPLSKKLLLALPMQKREKIAHNLRQKSRQDTAIKAQKSLQIMDVNPQAVHQALEDADMLIHGHTHRPAVHECIQGKNDKQRIVLGDWRAQDNQVIAEVGVIMNNQVQLIRFNYP